MALDQPYPDLDELLGTIGAAGRRLSGIDASEGAAGNISMVSGWSLEVRRRFPQRRGAVVPVPYLWPTAAPVVPTLGNIASR